MVSLTYKEELKDDIFGRYNCSDIENMTLQEFAEMVQYDYHNIAFDFTLEICEQKWQECQDKKEERLRKEKERKEKEKAQEKKLDLDVE